MFPPNKSTTEIRALVCSLVFASHLRAGAAPSNMAVHFKWRWTSQNSPSQTQVYTDSAYRGHRAKVLQKNQSILDCHSILSLLLWNNDANFCPKLPTPFSWQSSQQEDHKQLKSKTLPTLLWESWEDYGAWFFTPTLSWVDDSYNHEEFLGESRATRTRS